VLKAAADTGTLNIWVAFHGVGEVHDRQVNRSGAYAETCLAVKRARSAGLSVGGNVFLTTAGVAHLDELTAAMRRLPVNAALCFMVASFLPTPRSRRNEQLRPALPDLLPHAIRIAELTAPVNRRWWGSLEAQTEAAYVRQALAGDWPATPERRAGELALVCRPDLGVYSGVAGLYRTRHGNLRVGGVAAVLHRALAHGLRADDALWFADLDPLPGPAELAARYGDATGLGVHPGPESVRYLWLDRARRRARGHRSLVR
jgi:MoaA/NifB/PqqE/SkfB family radical SAM enzyme